MSVAMGNCVLNNTRDIRNWVRRSLVGDLFLRSAMMIDMSTGESPTLPEDLLAKVRAVPGISSIEPWTFARTRAEGQTVLVVARAFPREAPLSLDLRNADPQDVQRRLHQGEAVISTVLARRLGKGTGDEITLATKQGPRRLRVAATVDDYLMGGTVLYLQADAADKLIGLRGIHAVVLRVVPERRAEVEAALRPICQKARVLLHSMADMVRAVDDLLAGVYAAMWAMLAAGFVVAAFGVVNTLTMNVLEQTRELGLSRVVGMTRGQVRSYVISQAAVIGVVGLLPGAAVGEFLAYVINRVTDPLLGHPVDFTARPGLIAACVAFGLVITVVSAFLPAQRAAGLEICEAVQYE
jgi:putative ABC transport system permease protein